MNGDLIRPPSSYVTPALMAGDGGVFEWDLDAGRVYCCRNTARFFGLSAEEGRTGVTVERLSANLHPDDRTIFLDRAERRAGQDGSLTSRYRTISSTGQVRTLLVRGRYEVGTEGDPVRRRGIVLDVTASQADGHAEEHASVQNGKEAISPIQAAADHAIAARAAIDRIEGDEQPILRRAIDGLLWTLGRVLARRGRLPTP